jgi:hypothetical protein
MKREKSMTERWQDFHDSTVIRLLTCFPGPVCGGKGLRRS